MKFAPTECWCYGCGGQRVMLNPSRVTVTNGAAMRRGQCGSCGGDVYRVGGGKGQEATE